MSECLLIAETGDDGSVSHVWIKTGNARVRPVRFDDDVESLLAGSFVSGASKQDIHAWLTRFSVVG